MEAITLWFALLFVAGQPYPGYFTDEASCRMEVAKVEAQVVGENVPALISGCYQIKLTPASVEVAK